MIYVKLQHMHITKDTNQAFNLDHKSKTFTQDHNIKLVDFNLGFQTKLILHFYELPAKIYEM
jgi:hypothetical protein